MSNHDLDSAIVVQHDAGPVVLSQKYVVTAIKLALMYLTLASSRRTYRLHLVNNISKVLQAHLGFRFLQR